MKPAKQNHSKTTKKIYYRYEWFVHCKWL